MKLVTRAADLLIASAFAGATPAVAQAPQAQDLFPKHTCGELPEFPRKLAPDSQRRSFERQLKEYGDCVRAYVEKSNAALNEQRKAVQGVIDAYNGHLTKWQAEREAAKSN